MLSRNYFLVKFKISEQSVKKWNDLLYNYIQIYNLIYNSLN